MSRTVLLNVLIALVVPILIPCSSEAVKPAEQGVYEYVLETIPVGFEEASRSIEESIERNGYRHLATIDATVPEGCPYRARVFACYNPSYASQLVMRNRLTAPFLVTDRINLFEDERGLHVSIVNPGSIGRTILMNDLKFKPLLDGHTESLRAMVRETLTGEVTNQQYGQMREKGHIGKTMGLIAGGSFDGRIKDVIELSNTPIDEIIPKLERAMSEASDKWGMRHVYTIRLGAERVAVLGSTGAVCDAKSFSIVEEGSDETRKDFDCPGIAYAGAYPIEVIVSQEGDDAVVRVLNTMYRTKMYFEDAGKMKFMKNRGMPGSIQDEVQDQIKAALEP